MEHAIYLQGIKKVLKSRSITYEELALHLQMTESGIKKMLNGKDLSLRRLLQICDFIDILPGELLTLSEKNAIKEVSLNKEQEDALIKNPQLLMAYWCVAIEKRTPTEIAATQKIPNSELKKLLNRLVTLGLLVEHKGNYRPLHGGKFKWSDQSKLAKHLNKNWSELVLKRALENASGRDSHRLAAMKLSAGSYTDLLSKISRVIDEAVQISEREEATHSPTKLQNSTLVIAINPRGIFDD